MPVGSLRASLSFIHSFIINTTNQLTHTTSTHIRPPPNRTATHCTAPRPTTALLFLAIPPFLPQTQPQPQPQPQPPPSTHPPPAAAAAAARDDDDDDGDGGLASNNSITAPLLCACVCVCVCVCAQPPWLLHLQRFLPTLIPTSSRQRAQPAPPPASPPPTNRQPAHPHALRMPSHSMHTLHPRESSTTTSIPPPLPTLHVPSPTCARSLGLSLSLSISISLSLPPHISSLLTLSRLMTLSHGAL